jgi:hypothetical protein
MAGKGV